WMAAGSAYPPVDTGQQPAGHRRAAGPGPGLPGPPTPPPASGWPSAPAASLAGHGIAADPAHRFRIRAAECGPPDRLLLPGGHLRPASGAQNPAVHGGMGRVRRAAVGPLAFRLA